MPTPTPLGQHLTRLREQAGMSVQQCAAAAGLSRAILYRWETTETVPTRGSLAAFLAAVGADDRARRTAEQLAQAAEQRRGA